MVYCLITYNFISTRVDKHDNTQYFACKIPKLSMEIMIFTRPDMHGMSMRHDISMRYGDIGLTHTRNLMFIRICKSAMLLCIMQV